MGKRLGILAVCAACVQSIDGQALADWAWRAEEARETGAAAAGAGTSDGSIDLRPGAVIPDFRFVDFNGYSRSLLEFRGKHVMLSFWGTWCPYCRAEIPWANAAYARFQSRGFEILGMDYEKRATVEDVRRFLRDNAVTWTVARPDSVESLITERFRVSSYPTIVLLDHEGRVMPVRESALRGQALAATLDRILPK